MNDLLSEFLSGNYGNSDRNQTINFLQKSAFSILNASSNQNYTNNINLGDDEDIKTYTWLKAIFLVVGIISSVWFGIQGSYCHTKQKIKAMKKILEKTNTINAALGLCTCLFLVLPIGSEFIEDYWEARGGDEENNKILVNLSWSTVSALFSYGIALLIQKVMFSETSEDDIMQDEQELKKMQDLNELDVKKVINPLGRLGSLLEINKLRKSLAEKSEDIVFKNHGSIVRASMLLNHQEKVDGDALKEENVLSNDDKDLLVDAKNVNIEDNKSERMSKKSSKSKKSDRERVIYPGFSAYLLLSAISFHGFFQGVSLGVAPGLPNIILIGVFFTLHKLMESLSIGLTLKQAGLNAYSTLTLILFVSCFMPVGILFGILFQIDGLTKGILLGCCVGLILYQSVTELIAQEFTFTEHRYSKFFMFITVGIVVAGSTILSKIE